MIIKKSLEFSKDLDFLHSKIIIIFYCIIVIIYFIFIFIYFIIIIMISWSKDILLLTCLKKNPP